MTPAFNVVHCSPRMLLVCDILISLTSTVLKSEPEL